MPIKKKNTPEKKIHEYHVQDGDTVYVFKSLQQVYAALNENKFRKLSMLIAISERQIQQDGLIVQEILFSCGLDI